MRSFLASSLRNHPVLDPFCSDKQFLGDGKVLIGLDSDSMKISMTGVTMARYRTSGDVMIGSFALEKSQQNRC